MNSKEATRIDDPADLPACLALYLDGLRHHDIARIEESFAGDITFVTPVRVMQRDEILAFLSALYRAFPDWSYDNDPPVRCTDGRIAVNWRQQGTHTGTLAIPGFAPCAATGKRVTIPEHYFYYRVTDDGLSEIRPDPVPGGAPRGIFEQIGVALPPL